MKQTLTITLNLVVDPMLVPPPAFVLPKARQNQTYSFQVPQPSEGVPPYVWAGTGFPVGMDISPSGLISGTPTQAGTFVLTLAVSDNG